MKNSQIVISIIGFGNVGRSILSQLLNHADRDFCINVIEPDESGYGSFLDLSHASYINWQHQVVWNSRELLKESRFIFHCAGATIPLNSTRLSIVRESVKITESIFKDFRSNVKPIIIVMANPVDIISYLTYKLTGLDSSQIVGTGTFLDSIRMNYYVQQALKDDKPKVNAVLLGEHGESIVLAKSQSTINQQPLSKYLNDIEIETCFHQMKNAAQTIKETQGATYYAVAGCAVAILKETLAPSKSKLPLSIFLSSDQQQLFQCDPFFMSLPSQITAKGVFPQNDVEYNHGELIALRASAQVISGHINF